MLILVVDDDEAIRNMMGSWVKMMGHDVLLAEDGLEGIIMFNSHRPDLVITDCRMPNVSGATLTHHVKFQNENIPVIMFTGFSERFSRAEAERIGANEYLQKPVELARLKQIIETFDRYYSTDATPRI